MDNFYMIKDIKKVTQIDFVFRCISANSNPKIISS